MYASSSCYNDDTMKGLNSSDTSKDYRNVTCKNTNWLFSADKSDIAHTYWTILANSDSSKNACVIYTVGALLNRYGTSDSSRTVTRQSLYLSTNVEYVSGNGSTGSPFVIQ